jgi:hypothetical protein
MRDLISLIEALSDVAVEKTASRIGELIEKKLRNHISEPQIHEIMKQPGIDAARRFIQWIARDIDPTPNSMYSVWIIQRWLSGDFRFLEDLYKITPLLETFGKAKPRLPIEQRDIGKYTFQTLYRLVNSLTSDDTISNKEKDRKEEERLISSGQATIYLNTSDVKIIIPNTEEAAVYFGKNTQWCTSAKRNNQFAYYNRQGKLYILLFKKENKRYQFHFESGQLMDENDEELDKNEAKKLISQYFTDVDWLSIVKENGNAIQYVSNPSEAMKLAAIRQNGYAIRYINNPSEEIKLAAIQKTGYAIQYIKLPSEEMKLIAVQQNGSIVIYINNPSEKVQLAAVRDNGFAIQYINNPSEAVQLAAVHRHGRAIQHIENPSEEIQLAAIQENASAIQHIENPSEEIKLAAVQINGYVIQCIKNPSEAVRLAAVQQNKDAIRYIIDPSKAVQLAAYAKL